MRVGVTTVILAALVTSILYGLAVNADATGDAGRQFIFLRNGRTIQADRSERIGNTLRIETPTGRTFDLPSSAVLSVHPMDPPQASNGSSAPADVYRDMTQQMNNQVRDQIQSIPHPQTR